MVWTSSKWGKFGFQVKFDLEGQGQSPLKTMQILIKLLSTCDPNLVILARMDGESVMTSLNGSFFGVTGRWNSLHKGQ